MFMKIMVKDVGESGSCKCEGGYKMVGCWTFVLMKVDNMNVVCWLKEKRMMYGNESKGMLEIV